MNNNLSPPVMCLMFGLPGSGKSTFARQASIELNAAHIDSNRLRYELFDDARYSASENNTVLRLAVYIAEAVLKTGVSVILDMHLPTKKLRDDIKSIANQYGAKTVIIWVQTDYDTAYLRSISRDRRKIDDKYTPALTKQQFTNLAKPSAPHEKERVIVISGKHIFKRQLETVYKQLTVYSGFVANKMNTEQKNGRIDFERRKPLRG